MGHLGVSATPGGWKSPSATLWFTAGGAFGQRGGRIAHVVAFGATLKCSKK